MLLITSPFTALGFFIWSVGGERGVFTFLLIAGVMAFVVIIGAAILEWAK